MTFSTSPSDIWVSSGFNIVFQGWIFRKRHFGYHASDTMHKFMIPWAKHPRGRGCESLLHLGSYFRWVTGRVDGWGKFATGTGDDVWCCVFLNPGI